MRPQGDPEAVAAGARTFAAAADAVSGVATQLGRLAAGLVGVQAWQGTGGDSFLDRAALLRTALERAAGAIRLAASGLAELAGRLSQAQATWDQAQALAAASGLPLEPTTPSSLGAAPPLSPADAALAARAAALLQDAAEQAAAADQAATACFAEAAAIAGAGAGAGGRSALATGLRVANTAVIGLGATLAAAGGDELVVGISADVSECQQP